MLKGETQQEGEASIALSSSAEELTMMWHHKLGHMSKRGLKILAEQKLLLLGLKKVSLPFCEHCVISKQHRLKFNSSNARGKAILELIHSDVWQALVLSLGGAKYFVSFIDDYSRRCWMYPIKNKADVFPIFAGMANSFWAEAVKIACYVINRSPSTAIDLKMPMEMWTGKPADYSHLHTFGSPVYVMHNAQETSKLDPKSRKCIFLGYADGVKGYRLWDPAACKVIISRDVIFTEDKVQGKENDNTSKEKP